MSLLIKDNSEYFNGIKSQKDIILEKIHRIKSYNNNLVKEHFPFKKNIPKKNNIKTPFYSLSKNIVYDSNQNSMLKKVFIKPVIKKNKIYITKKNHTNNCTLNKNLNLSKIKILNKNIHNLKIDNDIINNNIINLDDKNELSNNNEISLNETASDYDIEKISKFHNNNTININNIDNNIIDNFFDIKKVKKNNIINLKNNNIQNIKKNNIGINRLSLKNNNINNLNILEKSNTTKEKDNINSIIINNNINKMNGPLYLSKLISLSNTINEIDTSPHIINTDSNIKNQIIDKKMKKKFYLNDTNIDIIKTNENINIKPKTNYYTSLTEANPYSKIEEIEIKGLNLSKPKNENKNKNKFKSLNYLETKRKILSSIENEKQKIIDESIKNYRKYLYLIQKQQKEYEEYDQYLKNELNDNQNNQIKLKIFKDQLNIGTKNNSNYNVLKNKKIMLCRTRVSSQGENKTISTKNFDIQKHRNKIMKKFIFPNKNIYNEKRLLTSTDGNEPLLNEDNESKLKSYNNDGTSKPFNKKILKINIDNFKFKKINSKNKNKNKKNYINNINNKTKTKNKKIKKNISNINLNYFSSDTLKKNNTNNTDIYKNSNNYKNNNELDKKFHNSNKYSLNNIKKSLILKKLMKNIRNEKEQKIKSKQIYKSTISNMNNNNYKSLKKLDNFNDFIKLNNTPLTNIQEIHRMITEEKKKALNNLNNNIFKFKENKNINDYYTQITNKEIKEINKNLSEEHKSESYKVKNGLYYSAFKPNKFEDKTNNNFELINS